MYLKIKNRQLETFGYILYMMKLGGKKSRMRTKLFKIIEEYLKELNEANEALIKEFAEFDEYGQLIFTNEEMTQFKLKPETANDFYREQNVLLDEEVVIELNETTKDMLLTVADCILEEEVKLDQEGAIIYDQLCEQFERIIEFCETGMTSE